MGFPGFKKNQDKTKSTKPPLQGSSSLDPSGSSYSPPVASTRLNPLAALLVERRARFEEQEVNKKENEKAEREKALFLESEKKRLAALEAEKVAYGNDKAERRARNARNS